MASDNQQPNILGNYVDDRTGNGE